MQNSSPSPRQRPSLGLVAAGALWIVASAGGLAALTSDSAHAGLLADAPGRWPASSSIKRSPGKDMLLVSVHPSCPCTKATLRQLERVMASGGDSVEAVVLVVLPDGDDPAWASGDFASYAARIPGVRAMPDPRGLESSLFDAKTSGQAFLYDTDGALRFRGGLTAARGHEGDSDGQQAILDVIAGRPAHMPVAPVFGCSLLAEARR